MEPIIKVDNVSMCFNLSTEKHESLKEYLLAMVQGRLQYDEFYALRDVSLDIMPGDFYGLVGLNGSGKSTLLKTLAAQLAPQGGAVLLDGKNLADYSGPERARKMALMVPHTRRTELTTCFEICLLYTSDAADE